MEQNHISQLLYNCRLIEIYHMWIHASDLSWKRDADLFRFPTQCPTCSSQDDLDGCLRSTSTIGDLPFLQ